MVRGNGDDLAGVAAEVAADHAFVNGDECGAQKMPRHTTVTYSCLAGADALDDRIEMIHEYQTCKYRMVFLTSKACNDSLRHAPRTPAVASPQQRLLARGAQRGAEGGRTLRVSSPGGSQRAGGAAVALWSPGQGVEAVAGAEEVVEGGGVGGAGGGGGLL